MINILQNAVFCVLFALGLFAGGAASAANAADVQDDYYDRFQCDEIIDNFPDDNPAVEACERIARIRDSQAAAAVSAYNLSDLCTFMCNINLPYQLAS